MPETQVFHGILTVAPPDVLPLLKLLASAGFCCLPRWRSSLPTETVLIGAGRFPAAVALQAVPVAEFPIRGGDIEDKASVNVPVPLRLRCIDSKIREPAL